MAPNRTFSRGIMLGCIIVSLAIWATLGALAYSHQNVKIEDHNAYMGLAYYIVIIPTHVFIDCVAMKEYRLLENPRRPYGAMLFTVAVFATAAAVYNPNAFVICGRKKNPFFDIFLLWGSKYAAVVFELVTGVSTRLGRWIGGDEARRGSIGNVKGEREGTCTQ